MKGEDLVKTGEQIVKKRGRGGTENFPSVISGTKAEDVKRIMANCLRWYQLPRIETDEDCRQRLLDFFLGCQQTGEMVTVEKMCLALGYARTTVFDWENGRHCSPARSDMIKKAKDLIATTDAEMAAEGKINPVVYIFRAKNYFGMKDQQDITIRPDNPYGDQKDAATIAKEYGALPEE